SPGHVVFLLRSSPLWLLAGDTVMQGSIGRFDFPGSNGQLLVNSIRSKILTLPGDTVIYPGHGPATCVGEEKAHNPFVGDQSILEWPEPTAG
ncbi:MAG: hypothetical protein AB7K24_23300, partial [Gemmataceae bacterium]